MKKNTETYDKILWECFKLFLQKGYKDVTIPDMENAIGMTRGAIFYYVKDKKNYLKQSLIDFCSKSKMSITKYIKIKQQVYYVSLSAILKESIKHNNHFNRYPKMKVFFSRISI